MPAYTGGVPSPTILTAAQAARRAEAHAAAVAQRTQAHLDRRSRGEAHPVEDFLYTYYPFTPGQLSTWHPGAGVAVEADATGSEAAESYVRTLAQRKWYRTRDGLTEIDLDRWHEARGSGALFT